MQIERETVIAAPVERVWALLTEAEHVGTWFCDAGAEIDLRPGGEMVMRWAEHGVGRARIVDLDPPRRFSIAGRRSASTGARSPTTATPRSSSSRSPRRRRHPAAGRRERLRRARRHRRAAARGRTRATPRAGRSSSATSRTTRSASPPDGDLRRAGRSHALARAQPAGRARRGTATTLAGELPVSRVAVIKHLAVLDRAGLVAEPRKGARSATPCGPSRSPRPPGS